MCGAGLLWHVDGHLQKNTAALVKCQRMRVPWLEDSLKLHVHSVHAWQCFQYSADREKTQLQNAGTGRCIPPVAEIEHVARSVTC